MTLRLHDVYFLLSFGALYFGQLSCNTFGLYKHWFYIYMIFMVCIQGLFLWFVFVDCVYGLCLWIVYGHMFGLHGYMYGLYGYVYGYVFVDCMGICIDIGS
jgi:hypothetical protein